MNRGKLSIIKSFELPPQDTSIAVFADTKPYIPENACKTYLTSCRRYAMRCGVYLVPWMFIMLDRLNMAMFSPEGEILGLQSAVSLSPALRGTLKTDSRIQIIDTPFARTALCVDMDLFHPEVTRLAALEGAQLIINVQYSDPFEYTSSYHFSGALNAAVSNGLWVASSGNITSSVVCPPCEEIASDGFVVRPIDMYPITAELDLDRWEKTAPEDPLKTAGGQVFKLFAGISE